MLDWLRKEAAVFAQGGDGFIPGYVPSRLTGAQLEELVGQGRLDGDGFAYGVGNAIVPLKTPALIRCISLFSGLLAQVITDGGLRIVDVRTGEKVDNARSRAIMRLCTERPNPYDAAFGFWEGVASDLLTHSNAVLRVDPGPMGRPAALHRAAQSDIQIHPVEGGPDYVYWLRDWASTIGAQQTVPRQRVVHAYWGSLLPVTGGGYGEASARLARPVLRLMRQAVATAEEAERYVLEYFRSSANKAPFAITVGTKDLTHDQRMEARGAFARRQSGRLPMVFGRNTTITPLDTRAQGSDTKDLRDFQIEEISRVFGCPAPLIGMQVTSWGAGIAELGRFAYRFGVKQFEQRLLGAMARTLLPEGQRFETDPLSITRSDPASLTAFAQAALGGPNNPGFGSVREVRRAVGWPRDIDGEIPVYTMGGGDAPDGEGNDDPSEPDRPIPGGE